MPNKQSPKLSSEKHRGSFYGGLIKALAQIPFVTPSVSINPLVHGCLRVYCNVMQLRRCHNPIWFRPGCQVGKEVVATSPPTFSIIISVSPQQFVWDQADELGRTENISSPFVCLFTEVCCHAALFNHRSVSLNNKSLD